MNRGFQTLFVSAELRAIHGNKSRNSLLLFIIVFVSLSSLGFGKAMLAYLKQKMDSPFVQFVDVNIPMGAQVNLIDELSLKDNLLRFNYEKPYPVYTSFNNVIDKNKAVQSAYCRKVGADDRLFKFILQSQELLLYSSGSFASFAEEYGCIVTSGFLNRLGFSEKPPHHLAILISIYDSSELQLPIEIRGVVADLPDNVEMLLSKPIFNALKYKEPGDFDKLVSPDYEQRYVIVGKEISDALIEQFKLKFGLNVLKEHDSFVETSVYPSLNAEILSEISSLEGIDSIYRMYNYPLLPGYSIDGQAIDYITIPFNKLDSIPSFEKFLKAYDLKIDMSVIEAKENFRVFNYVGNILSFVVRLISILLITLFSSNIILAHIDKNKKNLGTLKAFGLSNGQIIGIYTVVSSLFIGFVFLSAYVAAELAAPLLLQFIIEQILQMNLGTSETRYFIGVELLEGAIFFLAIPMALVSFNVYHHVKDQTPGDLIYERS